MGQKTNPISNRIGITRGWDSNWVGGNYAEKIAEDYEIRKYLGSRLAKASLSRIIIERTLKRIRPCPQGRAGRIRKRSNHVTIVLDVKKAVEE